MGLLDGLMPVPSAYAGLLPDEDINAARRRGLLGFGASLMSDPGSTGEALGRGLQAGMGAYDQNVQNAVQSQGVASQVGMMKLRQQIAQQFPAPPNETPDQMLGRLEQISAALVNGRDFEGAAKVGGLVKDLREKRPTSNKQQVQLGDQVTTFDPEKGLYDKSLGLPPSDPRAWVPSIERHKTPEEIEAKKTDQEIARLRIQAMKDARNIVQNRLNRNAFDSRTKPLRERAMALNQAIRTLTDAQGNPLLTSSAIANFIQAADQKAQIRWQLLNYFKSNVDPSIKGWAEVKANMLTKGTYPPRVYTGLLAHLQNLKAMSRAEYEQHRAGEIKRHPEMENWLSPTDEWFKDTTERDEDDTAAVNDELEKMWKP